MKWTYIGAIGALIIVASWLQWGFFAMLVCVLAVVLGLIIGWWLDVRQFSIRVWLQKIVNRLSD